MLSKRQGWFVLGFWLLLILGFWLYAQTSEQSITSLLEAYLQVIAESSWGPLLLLGMFALRAILLLPITILNVFSGFLFGPVWGTLYALFATLFSASFAYGLGRFFGQSLNQTSDKQKAFFQKLRERSFETILTGRLIFVPGDLINYASGFLKISFAAFFFATVLGGMPGLLVTVLAGASIEGSFSFSGIELNSWYLLGSALLLIISLSVASYLRKRSNTYVPSE